MRIQNYRTRKLNRFESAREREKQLAKVFHGEGLYVFRNRTSGDLHLQKPSADGKKVIPPGDVWEGDSYFLKMVPSEASLVRTIRTPAEEREMKMNEEKLILDQPDTVTQKGKVEHVVSDGPAKPMNETESAGPKHDVLLNEDPMDGVEILRD